MIYSVFFLKIQVVFSDANLANGKMKNGEIRDDIYC